MAKSTMLSVILVIFFSTLALAGSTQRTSPILTPKTQINPKTMEQKQVAGPGKNLGLGLHIYDVNFSLDNGYLKWTAKVNNREKRDYPLCTIQGYVFDDVKREWLPAGGMSLPIGPNAKISAYGICGNYPYELQQSTLKIDIKEKKENQPSHLLIRKQFQVKIN